MSKVNLTPEEFGDFITAFLFDSIVNKETFITDNKDFQEFINTMELKGMKIILMRYYLNLNPDIRLYYKRINYLFDVENKKSDTSVINITPKNGKKDVVPKETIKKVLNILKDSGKIEKKEVMWLIESLKERE